jgi:hypothetical protein
MMYGIFVYWLLKDKLENPSFLSAQSQIFCVVDSVSTTLLHTMLLILPYVWYPLADSGFITW